jgi:vacuolar-type H+-ATPase subunit H
MNNGERDNSAVDALESIKKTEDKAKKIVKEAREKLAAELVQKAFIEAEAMKKDLIAGAKRKAEMKKKAIVSRAKKEAEKITEDAKEQEAALLREAQKNKPKAVDKVAIRIKEILDKGAF